MPFAVRRQKSIQRVGAGGLLGDRRTITITADGWRKEERERGIKRPIGTETKARFCLTLRDCLLDRFGPTFLACTAARLPAVCRRGIFCRRTFGFRHITRCMHHSESEQKEGRKEGSSFSSLPLNKISSNTYQQRRFLRADIVLTF